MKTRIILAAALIVTLFASCSKSDDVSADRGEGMCNLMVNEPSIEIIVKSEEVSTAISDDYEVVITQTDGDYTLSGTYGELKELFVLPVGTFKIVAQNVSESDAISSRGAQRFYGEDTFVIQAGVTTDVEFGCEMVNSRVSAEFDSAFKIAFKDATMYVYETSDVAVVGRRELTFDYDADLESEDDFVYFNIDSDPNITLVITATRNDDEPVNYTKTLTIAANTWHQLTITSTSTDGQGTLAITVNDSITSLENTFDIDPYENE